jgi:hypothetical protein
MRAAVAGGEPGTARQGNARAGIGTRRGSHNGAHATSDIPCRKKGFANQYPVLIATINASHIHEIITLRMERLEYQQLVLGSSIPVSVGRNQLAKGNTKQTIKHVSIVLYTNDQSPACLLHPFLPSHPRKYKELFAPHINTSASIAAGRIKAYRYKSIEHSNPTELHIFSNRTQTQPPQTPSQNK